MFVSKIIKRSSVALLAAIALFTISGCGTSGGASDSASASKETKSIAITNTNGIKVTYTGMKLVQYLPGQSDGYMLTVGLTIQNDSDTDILVLPMDSSVNDVMETAVSGTPMTVLKGKTALVGFSFTKLDGAGINSADDIGNVKNVQFKLSVLNNNDSSDILKTDTITVTP